MRRPWENELSELVERRSGALIGYAFVLCEDRREAEDLVQEALFRVFSRWRRHAPRPVRAHPGGVAVDTSPDRSVEAYVRTTILNLYLDGHRRRQRYADIEPRVVTADHVVGHASGATARADVVMALSRLTPRQRACVVLRFFEDLTVPQIATALGVAEGTVKRRLFEALDVLRDVLDDLSAPSGPARAPAPGAAPHARPAPHVEAPTPTAEVA